MAELGATVGDVRVLESVRESLDLKDLSCFEEGFQPLLLNIHLTCTVIFLL
jgi:hypothetical protein